MVIMLENTLSVVEAVKWIGSHDPCTYVEHLAHKNVFFYKKCIFGPLTLSVGDYVLVSDADAADPDTVEGCDVAKILQLYELREQTDRDPFRAVVQWFSRPKNVPHKEFDCDDICVDFENEVIEEHRPYDNDISLETVFRKCSVVSGDPEESATGLLHKFNAKRSTCPMFVCRYKFIKVKKSYRLVPLEFANANEKDVSQSGLNSAAKLKSARKTALEGRKPSPTTVGSAHTPKRVPAVEEKRRRASVAAASAVEFIDINYYENKVSPIKIVGGRSVVRLSAKKQSYYPGNEEVNANYLVASPLAEQNAKVPLTPVSRASAARRNLNLSLDNGADTTADSDCLNYSIVKTPTNTQPGSDMKIKLRLSERRRSTRLASLDEDPLATNIDTENAVTKIQRKRIGVVDSNTPSNDIYHTPSKKLKESSVGTTEMTPSTRRKSILKSATTRMAEGTPKRSIQLSNIVEKRVFEENEIISTPKRGRPPKTKTKDNEEVSVENKVFQENDIMSTPKRGRPKKLPTKVNDDNDDDDEDNYTPKKSNSKKTPTKRRSTTAAKAQPATSPATNATPSQKLKMIRSGEICPTIERRQQSENAAGRKSDLQVARERLHVSVVPKSLPCREREFDNIYTFLEGKIQDQCGGCMYVSGVPGTGKTATVSGVIRSLQSKAAADKLPAFEFLEINGMRLTEPRQAYVQIYKQLTGKTVSWEHAHSLLEKRFTTPAPRRATTVLLVDELDILCNRRQDVVYNLLDWPTKCAARLVVVTIANTMDLPERLLMGKVTSRLGLTRLTFQPYTHKQLQEIVTARLGGSDAFKGDAVQLVARKVAAVSGDARRALDICRRATEIADTSSAKDAGTTQKCVNMLHVQAALAEMIASAKVQSIKNCSRMEQLFLQAVVAEVTRTGVEETSFLGVYTQIETIAAFMSVAVPTTGQALRICSKLGSERLLICEHSRNDIFQKILLNVSMDDIHYALRVNNNA